ncbi:glycosyltransferase [Azospirillum sp.]|uniref:glycosyltransferase n=1 Tax=Azospirillum sp. TaxID=34012 RepID=UPI002D50E4A6|nr:glycosyltransferase [Azospirillum sp.]HYD63843.1 glycosyltransferase [Azospirillum sp.]
MDNPRIFYITDNTSTPTGGGLIARRHVKILVDNGFDAMLLLRRDMGPTFFDIDVPSVPWTEDFVTRSTDIYVIPEPWNDQLLAFKDRDCRKVVFCQNHHYIFYGIGRGESYEKSYGVSTVFCCGDVIAEYLRNSLGYQRVPVVHNGIDLDLFKPRVKRRVIAYMPRKMTVESTFIRGTFRCRHPQYKNVPWIGIHDLPQSEVARILGESAVFLSLGKLEGVGLPPLEAMAAGCFVVGFKGDGGREFATDDNGFWCDAEDLVSCADQLARAMSLCEQPNEETRRRRAAMRQTVNGYTLDRMAAELLAFWREEIRL